MFGWWLDRWDERQALRGDALKTPGLFGLDAPLAFPGMPADTCLDGFCAKSSEVLKDKDFLGEERVPCPDVDRVGDRIRFPSLVQTDVPENNLVWAKLTECRHSDHALVVFHHWNASSRPAYVARFLSRRGFTVVEVAMPYHFERSRPNSTHADYMLSPNLGRTMQSMRQAVVDGRSVVAWLQSNGIRQISVMGTSLGSWVAGLVAARDQAVSKAALVLTGGSLADMVWTGRATRSIRATLETQTTSSCISSAWRPLDLNEHLEELVRPGLEVQVILAARDTVVRPNISEAFVEKLEEAGARISVVTLNCGHYSLALPPFALQAGLRLCRFLKQ